MTVLSSCFLLIQRFIYYFYLSCVAANFNFKKKKGMCVVVVFVGETSGATRKDVFAFVIIMDPSVMN
jgi:hypothetical protein